MNSCSQSVNCKARSRITLSSSLEFATTSGASSLVVPLIWQMIDEKFVIFVIFLSQNSWRKLSHFSCLLKLLCEKWMNLSLLEYAATLKILACKMLIGFNLSLESKQYYFINIVLDNQKPGKLAFF